MFVADFWCSPTLVRAQSTFVSACAAVRSHGARGLCAQRLLAASTWTSALLVSLAGRAALGCAGAWHCATFLVFACCASFWPRTCSSLLLRASLSRAHAACACRWRLVLCAYVSGGRRCAPPGQSADVQALARDVAMLKLAVGPHARVTQGEPWPAKPALASRPHERPLCSVFCARGGGVGVRAHV